VRIPAFQIVHGEVNAKELEMPYFLDYLRLLVHGDVLWNDEYSTNNSEEEEWKVSPHVASLFAFLVA